jgi:hypothetical protein
LAESLLVEGPIVDKTVHGVVHGKTIELREEPGMADGAEVTVVIKSSKSSTNWGDGLRRCAGALAEEWTHEDDLILEEIYQARKDDRRRDISE